MTITPIDSNGNSSKFDVSTKNGDFKLAISFTLRNKIWQLADEASELEAAHELAEAIVSRHNTAFPFRPLYILAEHNTQKTLVGTVQEIRKNGF